MGAAPVKIIGRLKPHDAITTPYALGPNEESTLPYQGLMQEVSDPTIAVYPPVFILPSSVTPQELPT